MHIISKKLLFIASLAISLLTLALFAFYPMANSYAQTKPVSNSSSTSVGTQAVLIGFKNNPGPAEEALVRSYGGQVKTSFTLVPAMAAELPLAAINALANNPMVTVIEPDETFYAISFENELNNTWGVKRIGAGTVHLDGNLGAGVAVAVIDSGVDYTHPELVLNYAGGWDFVYNDDDPFDDNGHGTHVAGTIGAARDEKGVVGVSPTVDLYALKILDANGSGSFSSAISALEWSVNNGIKVTNNSYGSSGDPGTIVRDAFANSANAGILHIAAAGNAGNCGGRGNNVGYPARYDSVVAVAATNKNDSRPCFSSTGPDVELSAPGVGIRSTVPGGGFADWSGTSMASPHVAGVAALVWAVDSTLTNPEIRQILRDTAVNLGSASHYGYGLVDAVAAVTMATSSGGTEPEPDPSPSPSPEPDPEPGDGGDMSVANIEYVFSGGRTNDKHLDVSVVIKDGDGVAVAGATVSIILTNGDSGGTWSATGTTGSNGMVTFSLKNAPTGCYSTNVTSVSLEGYVWDGTQFVHNPACK
jgi:subtilisin